MVHQVGRNAIHAMGVACLSGEPATHRTDRTVHPAIEPQRHGPVCRLARRCTPHLSRDRWPARTSGRVVRPGAQSYLFHPATKAACAQKRRTPQLPTDPLAAPPQSRSASGATAPATQPSLPSTSTVRDALLLPATAVRGPVSLWLWVAAAGPPAAGGRSRTCPIWRPGAWRLAVAAFWVSRSPLRPAPSWLNFTDGSPDRGAAFSVRSAAVCASAGCGVTRRVTRHDGGSSSTFVPGTIRVCCRRRLP